MTSESPRVMSATRVIDAPAAVIFELIADPAHQPAWDGHDNLDVAEPGQRVRAVGDVFVMTLTDHLPGTPPERENHVIAFDEGRLIAWRPSVPGDQPPGHEWRWQLEPLDDGRTRVTHVYDWRDLDDERREARARATTSTSLQTSVDRLAALAEQA